MLLNVYICIYPESYRPHQVPDWRPLPKPRVLLLLLWEPLALRGGGGGVGRVLAAESLVVAAAAADAAARNVPVGRLLLVPHVGVAGEVMLSWLRINKMAVKLSKRAMANGPFRPLLARAIITESIN